MSKIFALSQVVIKELYRRKDFYVLFVMTVVVTLVMASANFFDDDKIVRFLKEICLWLIWVSTIVVAVTTAARQIPAEKENRTIFPLLAKPVSRGEVVLGKFLGCWLACGLCLAVFYTFFAVVCASREHELPWIQYLQAAWLHWVFLAVVVGMALLGSIVFAAPSSNSTICFVLIIGFWQIAGHLNKVALQEREPVSSIVYALYFLVPQLGLFDVRDLVIHDRALVPWGPCAVASVYGLAYTGIFLLLTWMAFRRKALN